MEDGRWMMGDGILSVVLTKRINLHEIANLELSSAPHFALVWDPELVAVNVVKSKLK